MSLNRQRDSSHRYFSLAVFRFHLVPSGNLLSVKLQADKKDITLFVCEQKWGFPLAGMT